MDDALCAQVGPDLFFPEGGRRSTAALRVCDACPAQPACADHVDWLERDVPRERRYGAFGGQSARDRGRGGGAPLNSQRDQQIIDLTEQGLTAAEIATRLGITGRTVVRVRANHRQQEAA
ncbi:MULTISPECIES: WhiB family transcriptional regulator [unclassified Streptomyces]|uniref:WhiB family transcriptional regulator n=1 Tax=unclassified Streptomyces TaxID=2593676 RepID=UPI003399F09D